MCLHFVCFRGRLHTHLNGYVVGRPSSGSQSTNDSGVALLGENGSNKSTTASNGQNNHTTLSASTSNDNMNHGQNPLSHHINSLGGSTSPIAGAPAVYSGGPMTGVGAPSDSISAAEHHLLSHHLAPPPSHLHLHSHHIVSPHVQEYLNSHHHHHQLHQQHHIRCMYNNPHHGELMPTAASPSGGLPANATSMTMLHQGCCCPTIPPPPPMAYTTGAYIGIVCSMISS